MNRREVICSQQVHCLSCELSISRTGKDCRELTEQEIKRFGGKEMYIDGQWYEEPEINAYVKGLKTRIKTLEFEKKQLQEQNNRLRETIARNCEEEYE